MQEGSRKGSIVALAVFLLGGGLVLCHEHRCSLARQQHSLFVAAAWRLDWPAAQRGIDQACELWPANALYWAESALARERQLPLLRFDSPRQLVDAPARRQASAARHRLQHALALNPADALFWHNSAWLCWRLGDVDGALQAVHRSRQLDPHTAVYAFSCGYFLNCRGKSIRRWSSMPTLFAWRRPALRSRFYSDFCQRHPQQVVRLQQIARDSLQARNTDRRSPPPVWLLSIFPLAGTNAHGPSSNR
jgi:tetratricopeptide (TPR) repeat protein